MAETATERLQRTIEEKQRRAVESRERQTEERTGKQRLQQALERRTELVQPRTSPPLLQTFAAGPTISLAHAMVNRPEELAQTGIEAVGAAGGAAFGTVVGGVPGAIAFGAGGGRLGRAAGSFMFGEEPSAEELTAAGLSGAAGPVIGRVARPVICVFAGLPTVRQAVRRAKEATTRTQQELGATEADRIIRRATSELDDEIAARAAEIAKFRAGNASELAEETGTTDVMARRLQQFVADLGQEALDRYREVVPKELIKALTTPQASVARAAAGVRVPEASSGSIPGAIGALFGGSVGGLGDAVSGGAFGFLLGQLRSRAAFRLAQNHRFVEWATGLTPRSPLAQASLTFVTDVLLRSSSEQEAKDAKAFHSLMMDFIRQAPEFSLGLAAAAEGRGSGAPQSVKDRLGQLGSLPLPFNEPIKIPRTAGEGSRTSGAPASSSRSGGVQLPGR